MATLRSVECWDDTADVVVVGFGLAGAVAAISAYDGDAGADILVLEKMSEPYAGGNSRVSGQTLFISNNLDSLLTYKRLLDEPNPLPEDVLHAWANSVVSLEEWLKVMAAESGHEYVHTLRGNDNTTLVEFPEFPGSDAVEFNSTIEPNPSGVWNTFKAHVDKRPIRVSYDSSATDLIQDGDTLEIFGVVVERGGRRLAVRARRAVVMCSGGFENNSDMQRNYHGLDQVYTLGTPGNTGDGVKMLQKAGAALWHLRNKTQSAGLWPSFKVPDYDAAFMRRTQFDAMSWIEVAKDHRRFNDESYSYRMHHGKQEVHGTWLDGLHADVLPVHMIFDDATRTAGSLVRSLPGHRSSSAVNAVRASVISWNVVVENYSWSKDNSAEIEKGWITKAKTIADLAQRIGRDPKVLEATVRRYNEACASGHDDEFGRAVETLQPISGPPYYAVEIVLGTVSTTGGAKRNGQSQVLDQAGEPIPRLYEAGELGSTTANLYQTGSFLTECIVFGRIAGRTAVQEDPWSN
jgi:hypothetical protein